VHEVKHALFANRNRGEGRVEFTSCVEVRTNEPTSSFLRERATLAVSTFVFFYLFFSSCCGDRKRDSWKGGVRLKSLHPPLPRARGRRERKRGKREKKEEKRKRKKKKKKKKENNPCHYPHPSFPSSLIVTQMSAEADALRPLNASYANSVPTYVKLWTSFRCSLDAEMKPASAKKVPLKTLKSVPGQHPPDFDKDIVERELEKAMAYRSPSPYNGTSEHAKRMRKMEGLSIFRAFHRIMVTNAFFYLADTGSAARGMGLFARQDLSMDVLRQELFGWMGEITEKDYESLHQHNFPSLFEFGSNRFILFGPLSCANHGCYSMIGFDKPAKLELEASPFQVDPYKPIKILRVRDRSASGAPNHSGVKAGEEILVKYMDEALPDCECSDCVKNKTKRRKR
jgi:hypothetical protein